jgi:hypothetical protein
MEKVITILGSFEEADRAEREYYRRLSPQERLEILLELNDRWLGTGDAETSQGLERVYRITELA